MSTHMPGYQSFFSVFLSFCIGKISHHQHKGSAFFPAQLINCELISHILIPCVVCVLLGSRKSRVGDQDIPGSEL